MAKQNNSLWNDLILRAEQESYRLKSNVDAIKIYSDIDIFKQQIHRLKLLEGNKKSIQYQNANQFILQSNQELQKLKKELSTAIPNQVYGRIIELLNMGFYSNESNPTRLAETVNKQTGKIEFDRKQRDSYAEAAIQELNNILQSIGIKKTISTQTLELFSNRILKQVGDTKKYVQDKAELAEALAVEILSQNTGWKTIQTGNWKDKLGQAIIQDVMSFDRTDITKLQNNLTYSVTIDGVTRQEQSANSLEDFFNQLNQFSGTYSIILDDGLQDALEKASVLSTQVKSGMKAQPILTKAERNFVTLGAGTTGIGFFQSNSNYSSILKQLYNEKNKIQWQQEERSKDLAALANYQLSIKIAKTAISKNQLYFTEQGFVTASEWMDKNRAMIKFASPAMNMANNFLGVHRRYQIYKGIN